jgi:chromosome partitioning protein
MAHLIAVSLRKGGSGKTTTAINLATALHQRGQRVLLIDLDPQANATISVGIDPLTLERHINHLFVDYNTQPQDIIMQTSFGLSLLPSHPDLADTEAGMRATQVGLLKGIVEPLQAAFDYIVMDTPPSESYLTVNALAAADEVIIPLQTHYLALRGLQDVLEEIENVQRGLNPRLKVAGILPTMVNARTNISKTILETARGQYGDLVYPFQVDFSIKHTEASLAGLPILLYDPHHQGSQAYQQLAQTILERQV